MRRVILLWGVPGDRPMDAVRARLACRDDVVFLDQRFAAQWSTRLVPAGDRLEGAVTTPDLTLDLATVKSFYLRPVETDRATAAGPCRADPSAGAAAAGVDEDLVAWADAGGALVVNRPAAMAVNNSKPHQSRLVADAGFAVPRTLVTSDPQKARAFVRRHGAVVYKSVSGVRSIVRSLGDDELDRLADVEHLPTQFQEHVPGCDYRVHVVGSRVFTTKVCSSADDYRYASRTGDHLALEEADLPDVVADRCRRMSAAMGLSVSGIDLRLTPSGTWVCFEVNPSPAFVFYEDATGQPIGEAVADLLVRAA